MTESERRTTTAGNPFIISNSSLAFVELAPQGPMQPPDIPEAIFLAEAGHIAFGPKKG